MSFKSRTMLTLGRLKRGVKKTLTMLTLGRLRIDDEEPTRPAANGDGFVKPGRMFLRDTNLQSNNLAIVLAESSLL